MLRRIVINFIEFMKWSIVYITNIYRHGFIKKTDYTRFRNCNKLVIICNGPSINDCEEKIIKYEGADYLCVNFYPSNNNNFDIIRPRFFCMVDPNFYTFENGNYEQAVTDLKIKLEHVSWDIYIFNFYGQNLNIKNSYIHEIKLNHNTYMSNVSNFVKKMYDKNWACMPINTVAVASLFAGIKMDYKDIYIYGIDMSVHNTIKVNNANEIIQEHEHFYGKSTKNLSLTYKNINEEGLKYLFMEWYLDFYGFDLIQQYAIKKNVNVINCTPNSYVDSFKRVIN